MTLVKENDLNDILNIIKNTKFVVQLTLIYVIALQHMAIMWETGAGEATDWKIREFTTLIQTYSVMGRTA